MKAGALGKLVVVCVMILAISCSKTESDKAGKAQKKAAPEKSIREQYAVKVPVPAGVDMACEDTLDIEVFKTKLAPHIGGAEIKFTADPKREGANAACLIARDGKEVDSKAQKKALEKSGALGVLPGDAYCKIRVYCSRPSETEKKFEARCKARRRGSISDDFSVTACVEKYPRPAGDDAHRYSFYDDDTKCYVDVLNGHTILGRDIPAGCTEAVLESLTNSSIAKYKK